MKITAASALCGATAVTALSCGRRTAFEVTSVATDAAAATNAATDLGEQFEQIGEQIGDTIETITETIEELIMLPLEQFGWFDTISLEDAKAGVIKHHSHNSSKTMTSMTSTGFTLSATPMGSSKIGGDKTTLLATTKNNGVATGSATASPSSSLSSGHAAFTGTGVRNSTSIAATSTSSSIAAFVTGTGAGNSTTASSSATSAAATPTASCPGNPNVRTEWDDYSDSDRHAWVDAIKCLMKKPSSGNYANAANRYEDIVSVHQTMTSTIHGNNVFLLWHRYYLWTFEQILRDECGFDRAMPWWDETKDAGAFNQSSLFTPDFFGSMPAATDGQGTCVTDGVRTTTNIVD